MSNEFQYLLGQATKGRVSRREFLGRAAALGVSASAASSMLASSVSAQTPVKGGLLRSGMQGGESTNTLDPALALSEVPLVVNSNWGETMVDVDPDGNIDFRVAEEMSSSADAMT